MICLDLLQTEIRLPCRSWHLSPRTPLIMPAFTAAHAHAILDRNTLGIIMGGGAGSRLYPLTKVRSKPAVPLGGKYRLVDIPLSNCINSGLRHVYVLTQYNSASLNSHISRAYNFDQFSNGFVEVLAAQQTPAGNKWYQGTADAVRQNLSYFDAEAYHHYVILSGDQLYRMDYRELMIRHLETDADLTIATLPVDAERARDFGIMQTDDQGRITNFVEKPQTANELAPLRMPSTTLKELGCPESKDAYQASMGIYIFKRKALFESLDNELIDFGKHVIPEAIKRYHVSAYPFLGYWEDIGTIGSFYQANLDLCKLVPEYDFFDFSAQIYTNARFLPASKINGATIHQAIVSDGCIITDAVIENSIIGIRSIIETGSTVKDSVVMGADYFNSEVPSQETEPPLGIGHNCTITRAIIDKNARIGNNVVISPEGKENESEGENYVIRDGVIVIPKGTVIPDGSWI